MGEVSNRLSSSWQMRSDVSPPPVSLSFPRMTKKDHTSGASWSAPQIQRPPNLMRPNWASMVLGPFAETKGPRLPGRNPAIIENINTY